MGIVFPDNRTPGIILKSNLGRYGNNRKHQQKNENDKRPCCHTKPCSHAKRLTLPNIALSNNDQPLVYPVFAACNR